MNLQILSKIPIEQILNPNFSLGFNARSDLAPNAELASSG